MIKHQPLGIQCYRQRSNLHQLFSYHGFILKYKMVNITALGLGLGCLMPLSTLFQLYCGSQFYWLRKLEYPEKTIDLSN